MKKLVKGKNKVVAGVCSGFAEYYNVDPTLVRLLFVTVTILTGIGPGLLAYIIAWIIMPEK